MVKDLTTSGNGFTVNDVMETDFQTLIEVLNAKTSEETKKEQAVVPLSEFVQTVGGG
ncbi:MAG: hypothetical protein K6F12_05090 [Streptococcus sp.]|uniref:hypothetical protein n=1 Tax=Streptococcus sp. TaxID=1306 RepID=UPI002583577F|nr:hypothetical protein [Streptococcus sp.]MCR5493023.1 hypothetical protein [Streptococcus sp.]